MRYVMVVIVIVAVVFGYIILQAEQPAINELIATANVSINGTNFPDAKAATNAYPVYMWAIPGLVGVIAIVYYLKFWRGNGGS